MNQPTKQDCINFVAQMAADLAPHVITSARAGWEAQVRTVLQVLGAAPTPAQAPPVQPLVVQPLTAPSKGKKAPNV